ncbi:hypothetical protein HKCCE4037_16155 [Rhodobacterales bacterium HKCCE4037]|nr:hypothetical protein [Rhodobacterales bacterium HKCCE4037]
MRRPEILGGLPPLREGLIYIGKAAGRRGLLGRCHFNGRTTNHSPRKSLAYLLKENLQLTPIYIPKSKSSATWGLDAESDERLSCWMHSNLLIAIRPCAAPEVAEKKLIAEFRPPLNLNAYTLTAESEAIKVGRKRMFKHVKNAAGAGAP